MMTQVIDKCSRTAAGKRVMLVEGDFAVANSTALLLELDGYKVCVANTGYAALEQISTFRPQVVLLCISLKGMDGFETATRLRELSEFRGFCMVAVTGYSDEETRVRALASGCDHVLVKPFTFDKLRGLLTAVI